MKTTKTTKTMKTMKKQTKLQSILTADLKSQLVALRNQGKSVREMSEITGIPKYTLTAISSELIRLGLWSPSEVWKKRTATLNAKKNANNVNSVNSVKTEDVVKTKRVYTKRQPELLDIITINFKGINVQIQKSANIIVTDTVIYVK